MDYGTHTLTLSEVWGAEREDGILSSVLGSRAALD